jgi:hypothetical protein
MDEAWHQWSSDVNRRLAKIERMLDPKLDASLPAVLIDVLQVRTRAALDRLRLEMGLPIEKPRRRVKAGSAPWP